MDGEDFNLILFADSYKVSHHLQYPKGLTKLKSYFESRGGKFQDVVFFGLQYILKKYLSRPITMAMIDEAEAELELHFGRKDIFNRAGWTYILEKHGGYLPIKIKAVPEGSLVPYKNVLFTVESTDENVPWMTNYFETCLVQVWYPMTVCTSSFMQKKIIKEYMDKTSENNNGLDLKVKDEICD